MASNDTTLFGMREVLQQAWSDLPDALKAHPGVKRLRHIAESALQKQPEPVAWLVTGGRAFVDRAFIRKDSAELSIMDRKDGATVVPLYASPVLHQQEVPSDEAEFELHTKDGICLAGASGPRAAAWAEIQHYAAQYADEGPLTIYEVTRKPVTVPSPTHHQEVKAQSASEAEKGGKEVDRG
jgi:hypothetical protein